MGRGAAPEMHALSDARSCFGVRGSSFSAMYMRGTPGNSVGFSFDIALSAMSISNLGNSTSFAAFVIAKFITSVPNEWKNGRAARMPSSPWRTTFSHAAACRALATRFVWESIAPFDNPVVPPVYTSAATSFSGSTISTSGGSGPPRRISSCHQRTRSPAGMNGSGVPCFFASALNFSGASHRMGAGMARFSWTAITSRMPAASRIEPNRW
jgi:hypothetical protein